MIVSLVVVQAAGFLFIVAYVQSTGGDAALRRFSCVRRRLEGVLEVVRLGTADQYN